MKKYLYYVDYLRVLLTILVVFHHTSITYGASGSWYYIENKTTEFTLTNGILSLFTGVNQAFFMGFFFLISGYFTPPSFERKGVFRFLKDRFIRLGIPLVFYVFLIGPILVYFLNKSAFSSFWDFYSTQILTFKIVEWGPLWFVATLLYFTIFYVIYKKFSPTKFVKKDLAFPSHLAILISAIIIGCLSFLIRLIIPTGVAIFGLQLGYFSSYIFLFIIGIIAFHQNWFETLSVKTAETWFKVSLWVIPILPISVISTEFISWLHGDLNGGMSLLAFIYAFWEPFVAFGIMMYLLVKFRDRFNKPIAWLGNLAKSAYTVYIIHPPIVVGTSFLLRDISFPWIIKFLVVGMIATGICFILAHFIRKTPYTNRVL